jgi:putative spermidine/putrescine transport system substrate-binding protein/spermidine/putrescine transport system substrate-binding protein
MTKLGIGLSVCLRTAAVIMPLIGGTAYAADPLSYFTWAGYDDPAFRKPFTDKYGADGVVYSFYSGTDEAYTKLTGGYTADVAHPCIHDIKKWKDAGLLKPIDPSKVTAWNDLVPALRDASSIVIDGKHWMVPWEWGASSVIWRTDKVKLPEETYSILIDPAYNQRTALPDAFDEIYMLSAVLAGIDHPLALQEGDYAKIEEKMRALRDNARFIWTDPGQLEQAIASGEVDVAWGWPSSLASLKRQGVPVDFMLKPKEKLVTWECGIGILASAKAPEAEIYDFINALTAPQSGKALVEKFAYGHSNTKALKAVDPKLLSQLGLDGDADAMIKGGNLMGPMPDAQRQRLVEMWSLIKAGG